ncbi:hypothetical protein, partial [Tomitella fengzijianii]|uniref:hypothetical protein n=1 Tax=Tomitella fengzijianii TaxID=2597660 RepID=UPI001E4CDEC6
GSVSNAAVIFAVVVVVGLVLGWRIDRRRRREQDADNADGTHSADSIDSGDDHDLVGAESARAEVDEASTGAPDDEESERLSGGERPGGVAGKR